MREARDEWLELLDSKNRRLAEPEPFQMHSGSPAEVAVGRGEKFFALEARCHSTPMQLSSDQAPVGEVQERHARRLVDASAFRLDDPVFDLVRYAEAVSPADPVRFQYQFGIGLREKGESSFFHFSLFFTRELFYVGDGIDVEAGT